MVRWWTADAGHFLAALVAGSTVLLGGVVTAHPVEASVGTTSVTGPALTDEAEPMAWDGRTPQQPVAVDGEAQPVYEGHPVVEEGVWIIVPGVDSDLDGRDDRVRAVVYRAADTELGAASIRVPVVVQMSPYFAGTSTETGVHDMHEPPWDPSMPVPEGTVGAVPAPYPPWPPSRGGNTFFTDRGYAFVEVAALGTAESDGCPGMLNGDDVASARAVVDWVAGRTLAQDDAGGERRATWSNGSVGMTGMSHDGALALAASTTGVDGLDAVVSASAPTSMYDFERMGGAAISTDGAPGTDLDDYIRFLLTTPELRERCHHAVMAVAHGQARATGEYNAFWAERNLRDGVDGVTAPTLLAAGTSDWNVRLDHTTRWYTALHDRGVPVELVLHRYGHESLGPIWNAHVNRWFTRYLFGIDDGATHDGTVTTQTEDRTGWTTTASWPTPGSSIVRFGLRPPDGARSGLALFDRDVDAAGAAAAGWTSATLVDDALATHAELAASDHPGRVLYATNRASRDVAVSGTPVAELRVSFSSVAPNLSLQLLDRAPDGSTQIVSRAWWDPQNRSSLTASEPVVPGTAYDMVIPLVPVQHTIESGHRLELMVFATDIADDLDRSCVTLCGTPGTAITVDPLGSALEVPVVGGLDHAGTALGLASPPDAAWSPVRALADPSAAVALAMALAPLVATLVFALLWGGRRRYRLVAERRTRTPG